MKTYKILFLVIVSFLTITCQNEVTEEKTNIVEENVKLDKREHFRHEIKEEKIEKEEIDDFGAIYVFIDNAIVLSDPIEKCDTFCFLDYKRKIKSVFKISENGHYGNCFPQGDIINKIYKQELWLKIQIDSSEYWIKEKDITYYKPQDWEHSKYFNGKYYFILKDICTEGESYAKSMAIYDLKDKLIDTLSANVQFLQKEWFKINNLEYSDTLIYSDFSGTYLYEVSSKNKVRISNGIYYILDYKNKIIYSTYENKNENSIMFETYNLTKNKLDIKVLTSDYCYQFSPPVHPNPNFKISILNNDTIFNIIACKKDSLNVFFKISFDKEQEIITSKRIEY